MSTQRPIGRHVRAIQPPGFYAPCLEVRVNYTRGVLHRARHTVAHRYVVPPPYLPHVLQRICNEDTSTALFDKVPPPMLAGLASGPANKNDGIHTQYSPGNWWRSL